MEEKCIVLCSPISMPSAKEVTIEKCETCGKEVWFADSTKKVVGDKPYQIMCINCGSNIRNKVIEMPTDEQINEVAVSTGKSFEETKKRIYTILRNMNMSINAENN